VRDIADIGQPMDVRLKALRMLTIAAGDGGSDETQEQALCVLAEVAADEHKPAEIRGAAFDGLRTFIGLAGGRIAKRHRGQIGRDICADAESIVWERLPKFRPGLGSFEGWCYRVLLNQAIDRLCQIQSNPALQAVSIEQTRKYGETHASSVSHEPKEPDFRLWVERALDREATFAVADLERIRNWKPWDRVVLLCLSGLSGKVPIQQWETWLAECDLRSPFPPGRLHGYDSGVGLAEDCCRETHGGSSPEDSLGRLADSAVGCGCTQTVEPGR